jgi:hypothetical protein
LPATSAPIGALRVEAKVFVEISHQSTAAGVAASHHCLLPGQVTTAYWSVNTCSSGANRHPPYPRFHVGQQVLVALRWCLRFRALAPAPAGFRLLETLTWFQSVVCNFIGPAHLVELSPNWFAAARLHQGVAHLAHAPDGLATGCSCDDFQH